MSAFSRGCLLRQQCLFQSPKRLNVLFHSSYQYLLPSTSTSRLFATKHARKHGPSSMSRPAALKARDPLTPTATTTSPTTSTPKYQSYASTLAQKNHTTILYQAPSHTGYMLSAYSSSAFCLSYAAFSYITNTLNPPPGLDPWVPIAFTGVSAMMAAFGGWLLLAPMDIIRTITAIPKSVALPYKPKSDEELLIEVEIKKMFPIPFMPPPRIYAKPDEIILPYSLIPPVDKKLNSEQLRAQQIEEDIARKKQREFERSHIMTAPFRHANHAFYRAFKAMGRIWTREGFMKVNVKQKNYKLDVDSGWALDSGRALDRLARLKPRL